MKNLRYNNTILRALTILCLMMASVGAWAQTYYVFQNETYGYLVNNGTNNVGLNTTFSPSAVWIANAALGTTSRNIRSYVDESKYMNGTTGGAFTLGSSSSVWRMANNYLQLRSGNSSYYVKYSGTAFTMNSTTNSGNRFTVYVVDNISKVDPSLSSFTINGGTDEMTATGSSPAFNHGTSTYTPQRTNYHFNNADHYVNGTTATVTYAWALSGIESAYAEVDNAGKVTYKTLIPERERTATLTCTATAGGLTQTATTTIKFVNPNALYTPSISYDNAAGGRVSVTLSYPESDPEVKLYYTTDGSTPSSSSTEYTGTFEVASNTTVKVIAVKGATTSGVVSEVVENISTGVSGRKVVLDDREDHTWTYYAGVPAEVDGGNYNTKYLGKLYSPNPRNVKITYNATNGATVSKSETENTFIYYKTLEQGETTGEYPYQVISSPFSKRPTDMGFGGWKVTSGYKYIRRANGQMATEGAVLGLDEEITFVNLPYPSVNCTSADIVFETTWKTANITRRAATTAYTYSVTGGDYETNILVLQRNQNGAITVNSPVTIMMVEPDGSTDYRTDYTFTGAITPVAGVTNITKIENANWNPNADINAQGRSLWVGRGVTIAGTTQRSFYPQGSNAVTNQVVKVESGRYYRLIHYNVAQTAGNLTKQWVILGNDYDRAKGDDSKLEFTGYMHIADNRAGIVPNTVAGANTFMSKIWMKSGSFMTGTGVGGGAIAESYYICTHSGGNTGKRYLEMQGGRLYANIAGGRDSDLNGTKNNGTYVNTMVRIKGGRIDGSIYGGAQNLAVQGGRQIVLTGGEVRGWIAGGANGTTADGGETHGASFIYVGGNARVDSHGSTTNIGASIGGNVYAAGCGYSSTSSSGQMMYGTNVVVADNAYVERGVYGGGSLGYCKTDQTANVYVTGGHVEGKAGNYRDRAGTTTNGVIGGVFGGARQRGGGIVNVYMTGGLIESGLFGGSNANGDVERSVKMVITGGQVGTPEKPANIHGGGYGDPTRTNQNIDISIGLRDNNGVTSGNAVIYGDVYGGSARGYVNGETATTTYHTNVTLNAGTINGSLYGGGLGNNTYAANVYGPVQVKVYGGSVKATSVAGSGAVYGCNNVKGAPQRAVTVDIYNTDAHNDNGTADNYADDSYALDAVYGGGNQANYTFGTPTVTVHNCDNSIQYVYGGGNQATVPGTNVTINGGNIIGNVFGGGNNADVTPNGTQVTINGGRILNVYGGNNNGGEITGNIRVNVAEPANATCPVDVTDLYGGGNLAASKAGQITIGKCHNISNVYGGANQADVTGPINLSIVDGNIGTVFGGNNNDGDVTGAINVTVNWNGTDNRSLGSVYGGGNLADYTGNPTVNIINCETTGSVFGGGLGKSAVVVGNPTVNIGSWTAGSVVIGGDVFGGGNLAAVEGNPTVTIRDCDTRIEGDLYGGGNAAPVYSTNTTMWGGHVMGNVFGGGNGKDAALNAKGAQVGYKRDDATAGTGEGKATTRILGGTVGTWSTTDGVEACTDGTGGVFGGSNTNGNIRGGIALTLDQQTCSEAGAEECSLKLREIYGAGNQAAYAGTGINFTLGCVDYLEEIYGGAKNADLGTDAVLNITSGHFKKVFGGNNLGGNLNGSITVNIEETGCHPIVIEELYGCGNEAAYTTPVGRPHPTVNIISCTKIGQVFGGGYGASATVTGNPVVNVQEVMGLYPREYDGERRDGAYNNDGTEDRLGTIGIIYGGGNKAKVVGSTYVNIATMDGKGANITGNVYGGGNAADVTGKTNVTIGRE